MTKSTKGTSSVFFDKPLISTIEKGIPTKELINRLSELQEKLSILDDDQINLSDLSSIKTELINSKLLHNTNLSVQIIASCCVADILRLYAPNAPYSDTELSDIFKVFFKQFSRLTINSKDKTSLYPRYLYLLKRIAETKSIVLITELPDSEDLIHLLFKTMYTLSTRHDFPRELEIIVTDILSEVIAEAEIIPHQVIELILHKFENHTETNLVGNNITSPEFKFSLIVCENNIDKLSRIVAQYFSEILYRSTESEDDEEMKKKTTDALDTLVSIHKLSIQLWKYVPQLLSSVMALLDDELNADNDTVRVLATETVGQIIGSANYSSSSQFKLNFFANHKSTWQTWIKKVYDINNSVRVKWIGQIPHIIINNQYLTSEINEILASSIHKCLIDSDDKVREATCVSIQKIPFSDFMIKLVNSQIILAFFQLIREKHVNIRSTSIEFISSLYSYFMEHEHINFKLDCAETEKLILSIPNQILSLIYINNNNISALVDISLFEELLPIAETDDSRRVDRLLKLYSNLDKRGKEAFTAINKRQQQVSKVIITYLETIQVYNQSESEKENEENDRKTLLMKMDKIINWFCTSFPDDRNTYNCLERFYKMNRARLCNLIKICTSSESDYSTIKNSMKELFRKLSDPASIKISENTKSVSSADMLFNTKLLVYRGSPIVFNKSNVEELLNRSKNSESIVVDEILEQISLINPDVFKFHVRSLIGLISGSDKSVESIANLLKTIYHFIKKYPELYPQEISFNEKLKDLAKSGSPKEAKYSIKIIGLSEKKEILIASIINSIYPLSTDDSKFATHLSSLAEIFLVDRLAIQDKEFELTPFIIKEIFLQNRSFDREKLSDISDWITDEELEENEAYAILYEKLISIRLCVNNLIGFVQNNENFDPEEAKHKASPVVRLLISLIGNSGEIISENHETFPTPNLFKSKLRLAAGEYLLKLAKYPVYNETMLSASVRRLTFLVNDANFQVRSRFLNNLQRKLNNEFISDKFIPLMFFSAIEPNHELRNNVTMWLQSMFKRAETKQNIKFEKSLVRLIHILSHHEQFISLNESGEESGSPVIDGYIFATQFLIYYVSLVAKVDNVSLLYYLASRIKQFRDATIASSEYDIEDYENLPNKLARLYQVSELSQLIIKDYSDSKSWIIQTWPGKITLPIDIFAPMASSKEAQSIVGKIFIPENIQIELTTSIRKRISSDYKRKAGFDTGSSSTKKQKRNVTKKSSNTANSSKRIKKAYKVDQPVEPTRKSSRSVNKIDYKDQLESDEEDD